MKEGKEVPILQEQALRLLQCVVAVYRTGRMHALTNDVMNVPIENLRQAIMDILGAHNTCEFHLYGTVSVLNGAIGTPELSNLGLVREVSSHLNTRHVGGFRLRMPPSPEQCRALIDALLNARVGVDTQHQFEVIHVKVIAETLERLHLQEIENIVNRDSRRWVLELYAALLKIIQKSIAAARTNSEMRAMLITGRILRELLDAAGKVPDLLTKVALIRDPRLPYLQRHLVGTTILSILVGLDMSLPRGELLLLARVALFHELGMAAYGEHLEVQGRDLTPADKQLVKDMPLLSARIYVRRKGLDFDTLRSVVAAVETKRGFDDPLTPQAAQSAGRPLSSVASRVVQVCSAFDAMTSDRPFRAALPYTQALEELYGSRTRFDPRVVISLMRVLSGMNRMGREVTAPGQQAPSR